MDHGGLPVFILCYDCHCCRRWRVCNDLLPGVVTASQVIWCQSVSLSYSKQEAYDRIDLCK